MRSVFSDIRQKVVQVPKYISLIISLLGKGCVRQVLVALWYSVITAKLIDEALEFDGIN